ncbi:MAG: ATP-binding cassette domain-containing protein, partial [Bifidobacteriaceae bacterium]|nr:ATP-binding cassette domain-containing protein [Bifidobacteriaceae bacterium]
RWRDTYTEEEYAKARGLMERFGIGYLAGKQMWRLSMGESTRVMICRALMANSDLIILDEPTTGLDLGGRELVLRALTDVAAEDSPRAMVLVTHRLEEIPKGFDHLAIMGRMSGSEVEAANVIVRDGDPAPGTIVYRGDLEGGFTEERLESLFGIPLTVVHSGTRWGAFAKEE